MRLPKPITPVVRLASAEKIAHAISFAVGDPLSPARLACNFFPLRARQRACKRAWPLPKREAMP
jgi:hypothetical protein